MRTSFVRRFGFGILIAGLLAGLFGGQRTAWAAGSVIYVVPGGMGAQDGQSWANGKDLQGALTAAVSGDQLWVKAGTYTPTTGVDRKATFALQTGVAVYGGFAGTETQLSERNIASNVTILSGDLLHNDSPNDIFGPDENSYHVVTSNGIDATAVLDGLTISGGNANGSAPDYLGGGMYNANSSPTLTNVTISGNAAGNGSGGGMYNDSSSPVLTNVTISGNYASYSGGGIYNENSSSPTLTNVTISGNDAASGGGLNNSYSSPTLTNVTISGNTAGGGGGLYNSYSSPVLTNITISGNYAQSSGGGLFDTGDYGSSPVLTNVTISGNTASGDGGGLKNYYNSPVLTNVTISGNSATTGGGLYNVQGSPQVRNSILWGDSGGEISNEGGSTTVTTSIVQGGYVGGTGVLTGDPRFVTAVPAAPSTGGNLRLQAGSPAINAGTNSFVPAGIITDRDGNLRVVGTTVDLGAYENQACGSLTRLFVTASARGFANGENWANATSDLPFALARAGTCTAVTQVWVAKGTYTPTHGTDRSATFTLKSGLAIYGGFVGTETQLSQRNVASNVTILSGELGAAGASDNSYHVVTGSGVNATALLDGFTISGGNANGSASDAFGGGLYNDGSSPTLTNITISGNAASHGGGMLNDGSNPVLTNVTISGNKATADNGNGGGMLNANSNPVLTNVTISGNSAYFGGGLLNNHGSPVLTNVTISGNGAAYGGGMYNYATSNPVLTNVTISGNGVGGDGGGLYNDGSNPVLGNSIVWGNRGGAIFDDDTSSSDVQYSDIEGGYTGTGNVNADPHFTAAVPAAPSTSGNLHLQAASPAINAGANAAIPSGVTTDRDSLPRIVALTVDLGAFERQTVQAITFAPLGAKTYGSPPFNVTATATSGLAVTLSASGGCTVAGTTVTLTGAGTCTLTATQAGDATHDPAQAKLAFTVAPAATTTTLTSAANPSAAGQSVIFTANVTSPGGTPGGTVTFKEGATMLGTGTLSAGKATFTTSTLAVGLHSITATYGGDTAHVASTSATLSQRVRVLTTTTLTSSHNPSAVGQSVTFVASVTGAGGIPTGSVTFKEGTTTLGTQALASGKATLTISSLSLGTHIITAAYSGDTTYATSTRGAGQYVRQSSSVSLASSLNPSNAGQSVTFTAQATGVGTTPTGSVTFKDGTTTLGTGTLTSGKATFTTSTLAAGLHSLTAVYSGDTIYVRATSAVLSQRVKALTTTTLASSLNPSAVGQSVTFTAQVTGPGGTPTGSVTFKEGATVLGTGTLSAGKATFTTSTLAVGLHSITATYGGDTAHVASTSVAVSQRVRALTTTTLTSSLNPSAVGQSVTFVASVTGAGGTPTGSVTFKEGTTTLATQALSSGKATLTISSLSLGRHIITAAYSGDTTYATSTRGAGQYVRLLSTVSLTSSANPASAGQSVTFTAKVTGAGVTPTGSLTFKDGTTTLGTATLSSGKATLTTSTLAVGLHSLTAVYSGDTSYVRGTSAVLSQRVRALTTTTLTSSLNPATAGQAVTLTASVGSSASATLGTPTGSVTFKDGAVVLATVPLNASGRATFTTIDLAVGTHTITAVYGGSLVYAPSTSAPLIQTVH